MSRLRDFHIKRMISGLVSSRGELGPLALLAGPFVLTSLFSQFISNTATAVLVAPIAMGAATSMQLSPYPFLMPVALAPPRQRSRRPCLRR